MNNAGQKNRWINSSSNCSLWNDFGLYRFKNHVMVKHYSITIKNIFLVMLSVLKRLRRGKSHIIGFTFSSINLKKETSHPLKNLCLSSVPISIAIVLNN